MRVERFFLFFPPKVWSVKRGETEYGIGAIPLGGFVKITGMNPEEELAPEVAPRAYYHQPVWKRIVVIGAGPFVNLVIAFVILFFLALRRRRADERGRSRWHDGTPAAAVLQPGDRIVARRRCPGRARPSSATRSPRTSAPASRPTAAGADAAATLVVAARRPAR